MSKVFSSSPFFDDQSIGNILNDIKLTLKSGVLTDGPHIKDFETQFAQYVKAKYAIAVSSGSAALEIMLRYFNVEGKDVIVPTNTFVATPNSVLLSGGRPVFADISEDTLCINLENIRRCLTSKTVGVIAVHIAGLICPDIKEIRSFCQDNNLFLIEDAAHAHGAMIDGEMAGNLADGAAFSFYPTKVITTGQGGMITTNDSDLARFARSMQDHGLDSDRRMRSLGNNWCMSEITAIIGKYQLSMLEEFVRLRNEIARVYETLLSKSSELSLFKTPANIRHSYYKYLVRLAENINRDKLASILKSEYGIETGSLYYPPCHLHPWYIENFKLVGAFPVAETVLKRVLCLPMHLGIDYDTSRYVVDALLDSIAKLQRD
ncbi:MAG: DegT/DnrJ/EryC1/StrS family aminotransferase [Candidatus Bathyarchaeia archaeon]